MLFTSQIRTENSGACAREFNSLRDIILECLIGWDSKKGKQVRNGIFGQVLAWCDTTEEQGRFTLHSHILLFIKHFDRLVIMLWSDDEDLKKQAKEELLKYFQKIMCSSYDITEEEFGHQKLILPKVGTNLTSTSQGTTTDNSFIVDSFVEPGEDKFASVNEVALRDEIQAADVCRVIPTVMEKQSLRNLRQKDFAKAGNGIVACCGACKKRFSTKDMVWNAIKCYYQAAKAEYPKYLRVWNWSFLYLRKDLIYLRFASLMIWFTYITITAP